MQISYTLIVALMYVTILSFGFASLLTSLGLLLKSDKELRVATIHFNWILILIIIHFNMVWHAVLLTNIVSWSYHAFLIIVSGPTLAFFTATILAPTSSKNASNDQLITHYFSLKDQLLILFCAIQVWTITSDYLLERGLTGSALFNAILIIISAILYKSGSEKMHTYSIYFIWAIYVTSIGESRSERK